MSLIYSQKYYSSKIEEAVVIDDQFFTPTQKLAYI